MGAIRKWKGYTDDTGVVWNAYVSDYSTVAFSAFSAARAPKPFSLKLRYATCQAVSTGRKRRVPVGSVSSGVWTGAVTTVNLIDEDGATVTYTVTGRVGERWTRLPH